MTRRAMIIQAIKGHHHRRRRPTLMKTTITKTINPEIENVASLPSWVVDLK
jgi:hypothetical protein